MKIREFFDFIIQCGINNDPRGESAVRKLLKENAEKYKKLSADEKNEYDSDKLTNPYADSRILYAKGDEELRSILVGIDIETQELLLANTLSKSGKKIDMVLAHHPEGKAYATFYEVMGMQSDLLNKFGVPINIAESITDKRQREVGRKVMAQNHARAVDAAKLLGIPFMSAHTVADNHVAQYLQDIFDKKEPEHLGDIMSVLKEIPEYKDAIVNGSGPVILSGTKDSRAGRVFVGMTGGAEGAKEAIEKLADCGVGTIIEMHMGDEHFKLAEKYHMRIIIAGHISSDNLGMNLLLDAVQSKFGKLDILECSGFRRFSRLS